MKQEGFLMHADIKNHQKLSSAAEYKASQASLSFVVNKDKYVIA